MHENFGNSLSPPVWTATPTPRSRRDLKISKSRRDSRRDRGEISKSCRDSRRDHGEISKSRRDSRQDLGEISESRGPKPHQDSRRDLKNSPRILTRCKISARSQSLGTQKLVENLGEIRRDIKIIRRPKLLTEKTVRYFKMLTLRSW